jgi:hypothetical protein
MEIPSAFKLNDLLLLLNERRGKFNIRARQSWGSLYVLDLAETYKFLKGLSESNGPAPFTFLEFIDHRIIESKDKSKWLDCVGDCNPMSNAYVSCEPGGDGPGTPCWWLMWWLPFAGIAVEVE